MWKILVLTMTIACARTEMTSSKAVVLLQENGIEGSVRFTQTKAGVKVDGVVMGLSPGIHTLHIHENRACGTSMMMREDEEGHVVDLGEIMADRRGMATLRFVNKMISLKGIVGRAALVYEDDDDFMGSKGPGARWACGIIRQM